MSTDIMPTNLDFSNKKYPIEKPLSVSKAYTKTLGNAYTFTHTWFGVIHGFSDITKDNIIVVATVFDKESKNAVQTGIGSPQSNSNTEIKQIINHNDLFNRPILMKIVELIKEYSIFNIFL